MQYPNTSKQKGQALLIVLLIMAVVLTLALSLASRSVTDVSVTQKEQEAARAYSAAEAGAERALKSGTGIADHLSTGDAFQSTVTPLAKASTEFLIPSRIAAGDTGSIWLVSHDTSGNITCSDSTCFTGNQLKVCWGNEGTSNSASTTPALEFSLLYTTTAGDYSTTKVARAIYDPYVSRPDSNNFVREVDSGDTFSGTNGQNVNLAFCKTIKFSDLGITSRSSGNNAKGPILARMRLIYNTDTAHFVGVKVTQSGGGTFPQQGNKIESSGTAGDATRKVQVFQQYADLPPVFDFGLYSKTNLTQ